MFSVNLGFDLCHILFLFTLGLLVSGSWDQQVKVWDPRQKKCLGTYDQTERVSLTCSMVYERN